MSGLYRYILLLCLILVISVKAIAAQLAMPDNVYIGTAKHYFVDPNPIPGSTYIWKIDGVIQQSFTTNEIDIVWNTVGTYLLEVQELNISTCSGETKSGQVVVSFLPVVIPNADLSVVKTVNNAQPIIGQSVIFSIVATNNGADNATGVKVTDILQSGYTYVSSTTTTGTYDSFISLWTIGVLNVGKSETLSIKAIVNVLGNYSNTATIEGIEVDNDTGNNTSTTITDPTDFFIPDGFSPNGDGTNDLFVIRGIANYPKNTFVIFNRWGNKVFEASPYQNTWDGRSMFGLRVGGNELPIGTYFYVLDLKDGSSIFKGTIYLNR
jgi:gliding motility-associated-like protein/uncharacterized repeat protein (TIGR01451 family)